MNPWCFWNAWLRSEYHSPERSRCDSARTSSREDRPDDMDRWHARPTSRPSPQRSSAVLDGPRTRGSRVIVGVDGGSTGWDALAWAAAEASTSGRAIEIVHVVSWTAYLDAFSMLPIDLSANVFAGAQVLDEARHLAQEIDSTLSIETTLRTGIDVAGELLGVADHDSLIVIGRSRRTSGTRPRSVALSLIRRSRCRLTIVTLSAEGGTRNVGQVVALLSDDSADAEVRRVGRMEADRRGAQLTLTSLHGGVLAWAGASLTLVGVPRPDRPGLRLPPAVRHAVDTATAPLAIVPSFPMARISGRAI